MGYQTGIIRALRAQGLTVKVVKGWQTAGSSYFAPFGHLNHWTAGPAGGDRPSLRVCISGRPGLPGPLCNVFLPRGLAESERVVYVVAAGRANHAGRGDYQGADGNTDLFGTEVEWDGSHDGLTDYQQWALPRINAGLRDLGSRFDAGHDEYALPRGRKIDVGDHIHTIRRDTQAVLDGTIIPAGTIIEGGMTMAQAEEIIKNQESIIFHLKSIRETLQGLHVDDVDSSGTKLKTNLVGAVEHLLILGRQKG